MTWLVQSYGGIRIGDRVRWLFGDGKMSVTVEDMWFRQDGARFSVRLDNGGRLLGEAAKEFEAIK